MKSLFLFVMLFVASLCVNVDAACAKVPKLFSDDVKFVTKAQYEAEKAAFADRLEKFDYDVKAAVAEAKADAAKKAADVQADVEANVEQGESKIASLVTGLGKSIDEKIDAVTGNATPSENPSGQPILYTIVAGAMGLAGFAGWRAHVAASVAQRLVDRVTGNGKATV